MAFELDCRGLVCPQPVINTRNVLAADRPAELRVLVDNPASKENVARFLNKNGYKTEAVENGAGQWAIVAVADGSAPAAALPDEKDIVCEPVGQRKTAVLITTETLGRGDEKLGTGLMGNFLATLPELGAELWRVILLNGGVKLACQEGKALDGLKAIEAMGARVFVCGTCLNHYGLLEAKRIGETTNMLDIVTILAEADKVIRP